jgi:hypothetical protein
MRTPICAALALVTGCVFQAQPAQQPTRVALSTSFDAAAVAWSEGEGPNRLEGAALLRTQGGDAKTCAALDVALIPVSLHSRERMTHLYGNTRSGFNPAGTGHPVFTNDSPAFYESIRWSKCDSTGRFEFEGVPDGEWFVESVVSWNAGRWLQGGALMQRVQLAGGQTKKIVLAQ